MKTYAEKHWGDCSNAVAYKLNFVQLCYGYDSDASADFYASKCPHVDDLSIQIRNFETPKSGFSKKDYFQLFSYHMGVSEKMKKDMIAFGVEEENFRPIYTRKHDIVLGWQISPIHILPPIYSLNGGKEIVRCPICDLREIEYSDEVAHWQAYNRLGFPVYISTDVLQQMKPLNGAYEDSRRVIISLDLYNYLLKRYPRIECRPVFLGDVTQDKQYRRPF